MKNSLSSYFDSVVMLTWSDWHTELRSNRYHFATRFAKHLPVIFVQPDLEHVGYKFENVDVPNFCILHVYNQYGEEQSQALNKALVEKGIIKPLIWVYNFKFYSYLSKRYSPLTVIHGTEDYLGETTITKIGNVYENHIDTIKIADLLIAVSEGVKDSYITNGNYQNESIVVTNGCDYKFYSQYARNDSKGKSKAKVVFYQGNIFNKLDYKLLLELVKRMTDWEFWFCGRIVFNESEWQQLLRASNVKYWGCVSPEKIRELSYQATVGIIPFSKNETLYQVALPLKAYEYLACGLPVVSSPLKALEDSAELFCFAETTEEFETAIRQAGYEGNDPALIEKRMNAAKQQDYDLKFIEVEKKILETAAAKKEKHLCRNKLNIAMLYEAGSVFVNTIREHLESFDKYSKHKIYYLPASRVPYADIDLSCYDAIVIHYSLRLSIEAGSCTLTSGYENAIKNYGGYKIAFIQDEYDTTETACRWIERLGIHAVYTCVPINDVHKVYLKERFPQVEFIPTLTGYVSDDFALRKPLTAFEKRPNWIGYRGRSLPYWYGSLGQEKLNIGKVMKRYCKEKNIPHDIEWDDSKRIYGEGWNKFLQSCRATLGTESGSNIFDYFGDIRAKIEAAIQLNPQISFEEVQEKFLKGEEDKVRMNQVSPKIFESIAFGTALILFEGEYSGVVVPDKHYIPLKKDFSNVEDVLLKVQDINYLNHLTATAYNDVVASGKYSYSQFIKDFDLFLDQRLTKVFDNQLYSVVINNIYCSDDSKESRTLYSENHPKPSDKVFDLEQYEKLSKMLNPDHVEKQLLDSIQDLEARYQDLNNSFNSSKSKSLSVINWHNAKIRLYVAIKRTMPDPIVNMLITLRGFVKKVTKTVYSQS